MLYNSSCTFEFIKKIHIFQQLYSTIGQTVTQPMDVVKIRMQISKLSVTDAIRQALKDTGIRGLYLGLSATVLRQMTYTTTRLGIYSTLYDLGM